MQSMMQIFTNTGQNWGLQPTMARQLEWQHQCGASYLQPNHCQFWQPGKLRLGQRECQVRKYYFPRNKVDEVSYKLSFDPESIPKTSRKWTSLEKDRIKNCTTGNHTIISLELVVMEEIFSKVQVYSEGNCYYFLWPLLYHVLLFYVDKLVFIMNMSSFV